ncbi:hypothetical protein C2E21_4900 [Chlorella sorokiniana]|jgi:hypothetical protein|uniref:Uncharacterized protein n=1 Tax=Chlorella sorokiniana TaxID=3076 RepID=A0A2P6TPW3_CHLSO|nr:hypothetical protein C2E21_4900 [Chlorella sorokiniana]|eukprot:PRW56068.1 hypothetical protein C2E21_4900 [Chlorella sorokiniana]
MPRKELLVAGFRHVRQVAKSAAARKQAAKLYGGVQKHVHTAPVLPAKAGAAAPAPPKAPTASQQLKAAQQRGRDAPSFAAAGAASPAPAAPTGLFSSLRGAAAALLRPAQQQQQGSPSFAASPLWGRSAAPAGPPPPAAREAAAAAAVAAAAAAPKVATALKSNPLWKWAQLGAAPQAPAAPAAEQPQLQAALKQYAKLGGGGAPPRAAKPAATSSLTKAAALLKYAKLPK